MYLVLKYSLVENIKDKCIFIWNDKMYESNLKVYSEEGYSKLNFMLLWACHVSKHTIDWSNIDFRGEMRVQKEKIKKKSR